MSWLTSPSFTGLKIYLIQLHRKQNCKILLISFQLCTTGEAIAPFELVKPVHVLMSRFTSSIFFFSTSSKIIPYLQNKTFQIKTHLCVINNYACVSLTVNGFVLTLHYMVVTCFFQGTRGILEQFSWLHFTEVVKLRLWLHH